MECRKAQSNFTKYLFSLMLSQRGNMQNDQNKIGQRQIPERSTDPCPEHNGEHT